ncbi:hypothetical protein GCM10027614_09900 [Micromonospora vulcania]
METTHWQPPLIWRAAQLVIRAIVGLLARLEVTGDVPAHLRRGPLVLAANHISPFDPLVMAAACQRRGIAPGSWRPPACSAPRCSAPPCAAPDTSASTAAPTPYTGRSTTPPPPSPPDR